MEPSSGRGDLARRLFSNGDLANLVAADPLNQALRDLVAAYRTAKAGFDECADLLAAEAEYYRLA